MRVGYGEIDAPNLMINGNINKYPQPERYNDEGLTDLKLSGDSYQATLTGAVIVEDGSLPFTFTIKENGASKVAFKLDIPQAHSEKHNFVSFNFKSDSDEEVYGMGL